MKQPACTALTVELTAADLPVSCPPRDDRIWDAHPRVYLTLNAEGKVACPYCGTTYILKTPCKTQ
ncbi:MAG TPA: zinc-finger domain-containing protein [Gammaproteobacteria bacterium]|jgi:uncharacterized Zn-finger protein|nr:zinc-finger domain-containing protein [Gammaproteobacteria bacterium]